MAVLCEMAGRRGAGRTVTTPKVAADDAIGDAASASAPAASSPSGSAAPNEVAHHPPSTTVTATTRVEAKAKQLVWAKFGPRLPWWPARLASDAVGPTVAVEVLGERRGAPEVLRLLRSRIDRDFERYLPERAAPWKRRKCAGMRRAFCDAMLHAKQILAPVAYARCCRCEQFVAIDLPKVPRTWTCSGCRG